MPPLCCVTLRRWRPAPSPCERESGTVGCSPLVVGGGGGVVFFVQCPPQTHTAGARAAATRSPMHAHLRASRSAPLPMLVCRGAARSAARAGAPRDHSAPLPPPGRAAVRAASAARGQRQCQPTERDNTSLVALPRSRAPLTRRRGPARRGSRAMSNSTDPAVAPFVPDSGDGAALALIARAACSARAHALSAPHRRRGVDAHVHRDGAAHDPGRRALLRESHAAAAAAAARRCGLARARRARVVACTHRVAERRGGAVRCVSDARGARCCRCRCVPPPPARRSPCSLAPLRPPLQGGLLGQTEVISGMMMSFGAMAVVSIMWSLVTFSMAFGCVHARAQRRRRRVGGRACPPRAYTRAGAREGVEAGARGWRRVLRPNCAALVARARLACSRQHPPSHAPPPPPTAPTSRAASSVAACTARCGGSGGAPRNKCPQLYPTPRRPHTPPRAAPATRHPALPRPPPRSWTRSAPTLRPTAAPRPSLSSRSPCTRCATDSVLGGAGGARSARVGPLQ